MLCSTNFNDFVILVDGSCLEESFRMAWEKVFSKLIFLFKNNFVVIH